MCHSGGPTLCGLEPGLDFCQHGYDPETCPGCWRDQDDDERLIVLVDAS